MKKNVFVIIALFVLTGAAFAESIDTEKLGWDYAKKMRAYPGGVKNLPEDMVKMHKALARGYNKLGYTYYKKEDSQTAIRLYNKALENYAFDKLYYNIGNSLMNLKQYEDAILAYKVAGKLGYKLNLVYYNIACAYSLTKNADSAFKYLEAAIEKGYRNYHHLKNDLDLKYLREQVKWENWYYHNTSTGDELGE